MAQDPYRYFRVEAPDLLDQLGKTALDLEKASAPEFVARMLRLAHTLKGAARVVKQREIADLAHAVEDALLPYRNFDGVVPKECIGAILALLDQIGARVAAMTAPPESAAAPRGIPLEPVRTLRTDIAEMDSLLEGITETHAQLAAFRKSAATIERARRLAELVVNQLAAPRARQGLGSANDGGNAKVLSVAEELCTLLSGYERGFATGTERVDGELRQVRDAAEQLRLTPASAIFTSLERTARDAAQVLGKRVVFEGRGGDVRLDAHVLSAMQDALTQLVRNAVAHGVETESVRRACGKTPAGQITLNVVRRGRRVAFICADDGSGIDMEAVGRVAHAKGLITAEMRNLGPDELLRMLLNGGISTSRTVTEVSGRGVGLDVVREAAERFGGTIDVRTTAGKGTTVEIVAPLSVASLEGLVVETAGVLVTIPLEAVTRAMRFSPGEIVRTSDGESVIYEGAVIPLVPLSRLLGVKHKQSQFAGTCSAVVIHGEHGMAAISVDRLLGVENVVLRPLPPLAPAATVIAGASFDAEGNPRVVLDPDALIDEAIRFIATAPELPQAPPPILVIDDSLTTRMLEQSILESAGFDVDVAVSAEDALIEARRKPYGLFLTDIEMPGMDGFTFIERVRADPMLRHIPAILVSSRASPDDLLRGEAVGAQGYIVKSEFDQGEFLERIRRLVGSEESPSPVKRVS
jgi:two-component system, chemotaxis family, sensor kinase CheA